MNLRVNYTIKNISQKPITKVSKLICKLKDSTTLTFCTEKISGFMALKMDILRHQFLGKLR